MKVLIVSDSHGYDEEVKRCIDKENAEGEIDCLIHLGDVENDGEQIKSWVNGPVIMVAGNCDSGYGHPTSKTFRLGHHKVFAVHGHKHDVNISMQYLEYTALQYGCDIVMFGHTHCPWKKMDTELTVLNPGSIAFPRQAGKKPTYMVMEMDMLSGEYTVELKYL